jgi:hypothetical protein
MEKSKKKKIKMARDKISKYELEICIKLKPILGVDAKTIRY